MEITDVRVRKIDREGKLKAVVSVTFDDEFVVHDLKVIESQNGGFDRLYHLAQMYSISIKKLKLKALQGEGIIEGTSAKIVLVKPQTYINLSGESISAIVDWYGICLLYTSPSPRD